METQDLRVALSLNLKKYRKIKGWSQFELAEKAEISESNYSIQLCIEGSQIEQSCAIIGLQFREIYNDD